MSSEAKDNSGTLNWMYKGPGGHVSREEYLLGRKVDASLDLLNQAESSKPEEPPKSSHVIEYEIVPDSVARRRPEDDDPTATVIQVDMKRKLLDDPLLAIRKREELTKMEITNNPVKRKQLELWLQSIETDTSWSDYNDSDEPKKKKSKKSKTSKKKKSKEKKKKKKKMMKIKKGNKGKKKKKSKKESSSSSSSSSSSDSDDSSEIENEDSRKNHEDGRRNIKRKRKTQLDALSNRSSHDYYKTRLDEGKGENNVHRKPMDDRRYHDARFGSQQPGQRSRVDSPDRRGRLAHRSRSRSRSRSSEPRRRNDDSRPRNEDSRHRNEDSRHRNDDSRHRNSDSRYRDDDSRHRNSDSRHRNSDSRRRDDDFRPWNDDSRHGSHDRSMRRGSPAAPSDRRARPSAGGDDGDLERKRRQMMEAAQARDRERQELVKLYDHERLQEEKSERDAEKFLRAHLTSASAASSVEERIKSRVGARQRGHDVMTQNFLKK